MKTLISSFAVALAIAFTGPAFAGAGDIAHAKTAADCAKVSRAFYSHRKKNYGLRNIRPCHRLTKRHERDDGDHKANSSRLDRSAAGI